jgi:hypothetical protein
MRRIGLKGCPYCGDAEVYSSRTEPLTWLDRACGFLLLQLARCHVCMRRHCRPVFLPAPELRHSIRVEKNAPASVKDEDEKRERSA